MYLLTLYFCHNTSRHYDYQSVHQSCFWHEYVHSHLQVYLIQIFVAAFLSCIHFNFSRAATKGKTGKTVVLPEFCKVEFGGGSGGANVAGGARVGSHFPRRARPDEGLEPAPAFMTSAYTLP